MKREFTCAEGSRRRCGGCAACSETLAMIRRAFEEGRSPHELAALVGCSVQLAKNWRTRWSRGRPLFAVCGAESMVAASELDARLKGEMSAACAVCGLRGEHECIERPGTGLGRWEWAS